MNTDNFVWNDKLVGELTEWASSNDWTYLPSKNKWYNEEDEINITPITTEQLMGKFKQSKQPPIGRDWEVLSYKYGGEICNIANVLGHYWCETLGRNLQWGEGEIHSVRRISDGEVFTVGDKIIWGKIWDNKNNTIHEGTVAKFYIQDAKNSWEENDTLYFDTNEYFRLDFVGCIELRKPLPDKLPTPSPKEEVPTNKKMSFEELEFSQEDKIEMAAAYIEKYRHDHTMTPHRIAHSLLYPTSTMNAYKTIIKEDTPVKERIEVLGFYLSSPPHKENVYILHLSEMLNENDHPKIKQAIERVLNEDTVVEDKDGYAKVLWSDKDYLAVRYKGLPYEVVLQSTKDKMKIFTQSEVDAMIFEAERDAFYAGQARDTRNGANPKEDYYPPRYYSFSDYKTKNP